VAYERKIFLGLRRLSVQNVMRICYCIILLDDENNNYNNNIDNNNGNNNINNKNNCISAVICLPNDGVSIIKAPTASSARNPFE
jgi:hypothetical protein